MTDKHWLIPLSLLLMSCSDVGTDTSAQSTPLLQAQLFADGDTPSLTVDSFPEKNPDLVIASVATAATTSDHLAFDIAVSNLQDEDFPLDDLSFVVELSQQADFAISYRSALFDQHTVSTEPSLIHARTKIPALPMGSYFARVEVNPDWSGYLENNFKNITLNQSFRYLAESEVNNNYSNSFTLNVDSQSQCVEDDYERSNRILKSTALEPGSSLAASLCLDNYDYYSVYLPQGLQTTLTYRYTGDATATSYAVIAPDYSIVRRGVIENTEKDIQISADQSGVHYLALFGSRADYRISRDVQVMQAADWFFSEDSVAGPVSPLFGQITLHRLQFTAAGLIDKTLSCGRYVLDRVSGDRYVTPSHFPQIHTYHFHDEGIFERDGERRFNWTADGDIYTSDWYENLYYGWAENIGDGSFRYWDFDGSSFVECHHK